LLERAALAVRDGDVDRAEGWLRGAWRELGDAARAGTVGK
jgi:hypothetical protein